MSEGKEPDRTASLLIDGLGIPESVRWHQGQVWLCNWGAGEVLAIAPSGARRAITRLAPHSFPFSIDWLPDGRLLVVDGPRRRLLVSEADGTLTVYAELSRLGDGVANELVVDSAGNAFVNGGERAVLRVSPDGVVRKVADGLRFPNGMAITDRGQRLIIADSHAEALVAYDIQDDGSLTGARTWAELDHAPDGICADADGAIWVASVPGRGCFRVREGGEVLSAVTLDRGCFACMLGGDDGRTLFIAAAEWRGMDALESDGPGLTGQLHSAPGQLAAHAGHP